MVGYFCDTYALIEISRGSPAYARYLGEPMTTSPVNLAEFYYKGLQSRKPQKELNALVESFYPQAIQVLEPGDIRAVAALKAAEPDLSLADCIGYHLARKHGMKFLTGDRAFRNKPEVEFVP